MVMVSLGVVVFQVVTNAGRPRELSADTALPLPLGSKTASWSTSSSGSTRLPTAARCDGASVTTKREPNSSAASPAPSATPPVELPDSRTCILDKCTVELRGSSNFTVRRPSHAEYVADESVGLLVSTTVMALSLDSDMPLPAVSNTAPAPASSCGTPRAFMRDCTVELNDALSAEPDSLSVVDALRGMPPEVWFVSRTWSLPACIVELRLSLNDTTRVPLPVYHAAPVVVGRMVSTTASGLS